MPDCLRCADYLPSRRRLKRGPRTSNSKATKQLQPPTSSDNTADSQCLSSHGTTLLVNSPVTLSISAAAGGIVPSVVAENDCNLGLLVESTPKPRIKMRMG
ncbi:uncharacterized protein BHQ10_004320 [Talaromyces amestolkiae]|uniref:Uncharacterized protein n=1 Tax=Talaromyces amestolkiae TaxID=1196081 RepID=A0A364KXM9_TALAM|nr:uncharacterized protein BHQ10_004320 [Talaromyces amestolkiae]RAO68308.1 hypothetical protein BHQ10_004320 [Talaromyces amestolkiae]